jgi:signal transduction histidine kinase/ActR/RegA family two-component response regulator/HAMP domain-containing protein
MSRRSFSSLRARLLLLVLVAVLPAAGLIVFTTWEQRRQAREAVQGDALQLAELVATDHQRLIEGARQLLTALARLPEVREPREGRCGALLADLRTQYGGYANLGVADTEGNIVCSALPLVRPVNISDRGWFQRALATRAFAMGEYQVGRLTGRATVNFGQPVLDGEGRVQAVVFAALDLGWLNTLAQRAAVPPGSTFTVLDRSGLILARYPDAERWIGKRAPDARLVTRILSQRKGVAEDRGLDGVQRLYGFTPLDEEREGGAVYVSIGIPAAGAYAGVRRTLLWNLAGLLLAAIVVFVATRQFAERFILKRVDTLVSVTDRFAAGDLNVRTGLAHEHGELGQLGRAFDRMAEALRRRQDESERRRREAESLAAVGRAILQTLDPREIGQRIAESLRDMLGGTAATLYRREPVSDDLVAVGASGDQGPIEGPLGLPKGTGVAGLAVRLGTPITTADLLADPRIALQPEERARIEQAGFRAVLAVPLVVQGGVIGALAVGDRSGRVWTDDEVQLAHAFADHGAIALENAQLVQELQMRQSRLEALLETSRQLARIQPLDALLGRIVESCRELLRADWVGFRVVEGEELVVRASAGDASEAMRSERLPKGYGLSWVVAASGEPLVVRDPGEDPRTLPEQREAPSAYRAWLGIPVKVGEHVVGVLNMGTRGEAGFSTADVAIATAFASQAAVAMENSRLYQEIQRAYEDLTQTQDQLVQAQKMEAIGRLTGGIAHDFNNLLTVISGRSHLALDALPADHPQRRSLELIGRTAERAAALTRQLLAFSRRQILQPKVLDLNAVVSGLAPMLQRLIGEDIVFVTAPSPDLGRVKADPSQLEQVILNLAVNARDAMPQGGKLTIETANVELDDAYARRHAGVTPGRYVLLAVSDTGCGMGAETQARIFEPFFTTKEPGKGTGLGLATVYGVLQQSGGHIWVYSEPGQGATFKIYLPRVDDAAEPEGPVRATAPARGSEAILLVEDDEEVRAIARETLEGAGYEVLAASSAAEGLHLAGGVSRPLRLLLTDVVMPQMSGRELAQRMAGSHRDLRVLYISGYTDDAIVRHGVLEEGVAFLQKPFTPEMLLRRVREAIDGAR